MSPSCCLHENIKKYPEKDRYNILRADRLRKSIKGSNGLRSHFWFLCFVFYKLYYVRIDHFLCQDPFKNSKKGYSTKSNSLDFYFILYIPFELCVNVVTSIFTYIFIQKQNFLPLG